MIVPLLACLTSFVAGATLTLALQRKTTLIRIARCDDGFAIGIRRIAQ